MAVSRTSTLLSIDEWAQILQISPWDINQFQYPGPKSAQCQDVIYQYGWQKDHLSREEIGEAIASAEKMIADELLYWPAPYYTLDEPITYPRPHQPDLFGFAGTPKGEWKSVGTRWHKFIKGGVLNRTHLGTIEGSALTSEDRDNDGTRETFVATITDAAIATITDWSEIALYFGDDDRHKEPLDETWRIRPIKVLVVGDTATIWGHRTVITRPSPEYGVDATPLDADDDNNYASKVECYRTFTDTNSTVELPYQGVAQWKTIPGCTDGCDFAVYPLCLNAQQVEQGQIIATFGLACNWPFPSREPDRLSVNYLSGVPLSNGRMDKIMAQCVAYLSVSLLANEKCGCDRTNRVLEKYRAPILKFADRTANADSYAEASNTFPSTYGGQWAWARIRQNRHIEAVGV